MIEIPAGFKFSLNGDGTEIVCGYQTNVRRVPLVIGPPAHWPEPGEWYPAGFDWDQTPAVFRALTASPPTTEAKAWDGDVIGQPQHAIGHADLHVIDGDRLSTNGAQIFYNGTDITPEPFNGVVWDDPDSYGYKRGWDGSGPFCVRALPDNQLVREIPDGGMWERPYTLASGFYVSGQYGAEARVHAPTFLVTLPPLERSGPVFERDGVVYLVSLVMGAGGNPRGVMVRPLESLRPADDTQVPSRLGWWLPELRHQGVQARVRPDADHTIVIAGAEFPGSGLITIAEINPARPMTIVPPETVEPPVDPPKPDPPPAPLRELKLVVSTELGQAPLTVEARVYDADQTTPLTFFVRRQPDTTWALDSVKSAGDAQHFYQFTVAGTYDTRARQVGAVDSNIRTVTVAAPPPPPPPEPTPPSGGWLARLLALLRRVRR